MSYQAIRAYLALQPETGGGDPNGAPDPQDQSLQGLLWLSRGTAIILLVVYVLYLNFQVRYDGPVQISSLTFSRQLNTHASLFEAEEGDDEDAEVAEMDTYSAAAWLVAVTVVTAFCADVLVSSIDETAQKLHLPKAFIGLILLPIVGNAAEHVTSVWMAMKGKTELTIGVAVGSSIQIAAGMIPILVIIAWPMKKDLTLYFADFETIVLFCESECHSLLLTWILIASLRLVSGRHARQLAASRRSRQLHGRRLARGALPGHRVVVHRDGVKIARFDQKTEGDAEEEGGTHGAEMRGVFGDGGAAAGWRLESMAGRKVLEKLKRTKRDECFV